MQHLAKTKEEWELLLAGNEPGVVRSLDDWNALRNAPDFALRDLPSGDVQRFTDALEFRNGGLAHADYRHIKDKMTVAQYKQLWAHFGLSMKLIADYDDRWCDSPGNCIMRDSTVCTSNC
ncbi:hypothetical protein GO290_02744 [Ralstonia solanacearum]|nr:hypothetical protein [Ralstonia solanacearum]